MDHPKPLYYDDMKGKIIKAIVLHKIYKKTQIKKHLNLSDKIFKEHFDQLVKEKIIFHRGYSVYWVNRKIKQAYTEYSEEVEASNIVHKNDPKQGDIIDWLRTQNDDFEDHFYLSGEKFDLFLRSIINHATSEIVIVSPFVGQVDNINRLMFLDKKIKRKLITRYPNPDNRSLFNEILAKGIEIETPETDFHAKLQLFDNKIAIVSSYNFDKYSASKNWEAGLVTISPKVIAEIRESINQLTSRASLN